MVTFKRIVLAERPETDIQDNTFKTETAPLPDKSSLKDDEVLIKVEHLSLDPGKAKTLVACVSMVKELTFPHTSPSHAWMAPRYPIIPTSGKEIGRAHV